MRARTSLASINPPLLAAAHPSAILTLNSALFAAGQESLRRNSSRDTRLLYRNPNPYPAGDFLLPSGFHILVDGRTEAIDQSASQMGALFLG
jgi:hypothetical protein